MIKKLLFAMSVLVLGCSSATPPPSLSVMELYSQGEKAFIKKKYEDAVESLKRIKLDFPESRKLAQIRLKIADSYYLDKKYEEAVSEYKEFIEYHSAHEQKDMAKYRIGKSLYKQMLPYYMDQTKTEEAIKQFNELVKEFPNSPYSRKALKRIKNCTDRLAKHEYFIGNFYYRTEQYKAAIRRLRGLLENFSEQKIEPMVISLLAESYWEGEENERALKTYKEIILRYPGTTYAKHADFMLKKYGEQYGVGVELEESK